MANTVNQPDGSSVTQQNPSGVATGGDLTWQEVYTLDLSAQSAHDFTATSTLSMGGVTWTAHNNASGDFQADGFELDAVDGLRIWPNSAKKVYTTEVAAGILGAKVADLVSGYSMSSMAVCFQVYATASTDLNSNYDAWGALVWNGYTGTGQNDVRYILARGIHESSDKAQIVGYTENNGSSSTWMDYEVAAAAQADRDFFQIIVWPGPDYISALCGFVGNMPDSGDFPDPNSFTPTIGTSVMFSDNTDGSAFTTANLRVGIVAQDEGAATDINPIFHKLRVLKLEV